MSNIWATDRRAFLAGLGLALVGSASLRNEAAAATQRLKLRARPGSVALRPGQPEAAVRWLEAPEAVLRFKRGSELDIALQNDLPAPVALNWHGLDGIAAADAMTGQPPLAAGARAGFKASLRHAGTLFADLSLLADGSAPPTRALPLIVEESEPQEVDRDEVLLIEDFRLRSDGIAVSPALEANDATTLYTLNGLISPDIAVQSNQRLRLRFINACQRHVIAVKIDGLEVRVMALDGQPAEPFFARNSAIVLPPGGRADAFTDVTAQSGAASPILLHDGRQARPIGRLAISGERPARSSALAAAPPLPSNGLPPQLELKAAQRFEIALNGSEWGAPARFTVSMAPAFRIKQGRIVVLALSNRAPIAIVFHLHGHHFRLLDRLDDGWKPYWLDTLAIESGQTQRIAFAAEYAGRWLLESAAMDWAAPKLLRWYSVE